MTVPSMGRGMIFAYQAFQQLWSYLRSDLKWETSDSHHACTCEVGTTEASKYQSSATSRSVLVDTKLLMKTNNLSGAKDIPARRLMRLGSKSR